MWDQLRRWCFKNLRDRQGCRRFEYADLNMPQLTLVNFPFLNFHVKGKVRDRSICDGIGVSQYLKCLRCRSTNSGAHSDGTQHTAEVEMETSCRSLRTVKSKTKETKSLLCSFSEDTKAFTVWIGLDLTKMTMI